MIALPERWREPFAAGARAVALDIVDLVEAESALRTFVSEICASNQWTVSVARGCLCHGAIQPVRPSGTTAEFAALVTKASVPVRRAGLPRSPLAITLLGGT